jgi:hypothetical protein
VTGTPNRQATFDALSIVGGLEDLGFGVSQAEAHCFAYLGCLTAIYGKELSTWGYEFTALRTSRPFAVDLDDAIRTGRTAGFLVRDGEELRLTNTGRELLGVLGTGLPQARQECLSAACAVSLAIAIPTALAALTMEPQLERAIALGSERPLLDEVGLEVLSERLPTDSSHVGRLTFWVSYWSARRERADRAHLA